MSFFSAVFAWIQANPVLFEVLWGVFTGAVSLAAKALDGTPRGHAVMQLLASLGLDLPKALDALKRLITGAQPPPPPPPVVVQKPEDPSTLPYNAPKPPGLMFAALVFVTCAASSFVACDWAKAKAPEIAFDAAKAAICVLEHRAEPPETVAFDCGGLTLQDVLKLLAAKEKIASEARVGACGK